MYGNLFLESDGVAALNSLDKAKCENFDWVATDFINWIIFRQFGVDYFWFEWNVSFMLRTLWMRLRNPKGCS